MRHAYTFILLAASLAFSSTAPISAQGRGAGQAHGPKTTVSHGPKTTATHGPTMAQGHGPKTTTPHGPKTATPRGPKTTTTAKGTTTRGPGSTHGQNTTTTPTTTTTVTTAGALPKNPRLVERLRTLLPAGTDMNAAATGFKNQGQFVAAVHVSNNLGLSFTELKSRMVNQGMSLGQAIQQLRPGIDADDAVGRATREADDDLASPRASHRNPRR